MTGIETGIDDALVDIATNRVENEAVAARFPTLPSLKFSPYRSRRNRLPPKLRRHCEGKWQKTLSGEKMKFLSDLDEWAVYTAYVELICSQWPQNQQPSGGMAQLLEKNFKEGTPKPP